MPRGEVSFSPTSLFTSDLPTIEFQEQDNDFKSEERGIGTFGASLGGLGSMETDTTAKDTDKGESDDDRIASMGYSNTQGSA